jgi:hypothetical protein
MDVTKLIGAFRDIANARSNGSIRQWQLDSVSGNKPADSPPSGHSGALCETSLTVNLTVSLTVNLTMSRTVNLTVSLTVSLTVNLTMSRTVNLTVSLTVSLAELSFLMFCVLQQSVTQVTVSS